MAQSWRTNINIGVRDLIDQATGDNQNERQKGHGFISGLFIGSSTSDRRYDNGSRFVVVRAANNMHYVAYFHPTKWHSAKYEGGRLPWDRSSAEASAQPGYWAVCSGQTRWSGKNEAWYVDGS
jgi:hypothetical protein